MIRWEYYVTMLSPKSLEVDLCIYGSQGWELVSATNMESGMVRFIFKRPIDKTPRKK